METIILKGEIAKDRILAETRTQVSDLKKMYEKKPGIAFIGFEGVPLAKYTVPLHVHLAEDLGFRVFLEMQKEDIGEKDVLDLIMALNMNEDVHAIVVFQPVPAHLNPMRIINRIDPAKEVEGFHPQNMLSTLLPDVIPGRFPMCLPAALQEILSEAKLSPGGDQQWLFLADDEFLVNPLTKMIIHTAAMKVVPAGCRMTFLCRSSRFLMQECKQADWLVVVTKHPEYLNPQFLKPGVVIIDIYSNLVQELPSKKDPDKLIPVIRGGISAEAAMNIAGAILPIPGGLMTTVLAILFNNAMLAFRYKMEMAEGSRSPVMVS
jgi:methylenetetrahydrofolate dehydrogenase (NADP+) / methenyltetrahydrofolate cyclohydrolase